MPRQRVSTKGELIVAEKDEEGTEVEKLNARVARLEALVRNQGKPRSFVQTESSDALKSYLAEKCDRYEVKKRGLVAIINNFTIPGESSFRPGAIEEEERIREFFQSKNFGQHYDVHREECDLSKSRFNQVLDELVDKLEQSDGYDRFFLFIMSHGKKDVVSAYHKEGETPETLSIHDDIVCKFEKSIKDCPKVIVFETCHGLIDNQRSLRQAFPFGAKRQKIGDGNDIPADESLQMVTPNAADMLIAYASVKGYSSYRNDDNQGAWFMRYFLEQLRRSHEEQYYSSHLVNILTKVQILVSQHDGYIIDKKDGRKYTVRQMPCFLSSLRKKFYLVPPTLPSAGQL